MTDAPSLDTPEADGDGYLTEEWLDLLRAKEFTVSEARQFLLETFPEAAELMQPYATIRISDVKDRPAKEIYFATGGWSGCEDLIEAMLSQPLIAYHHTQWKRGGAYWFEAPNPQAGETDA